MRHWVHFGTGVAASVLHPQVPLPLLHAIQMLLWFPREAPSRSGAHLVLSLPLEFGSLMGDCR